MTLRIGIIGLGGNAGKHQGYLTAGKIPEAELTAVADIDPVKLDQAERIYGDKVKCFDSAETLLDSGAVDAIIICTPHYYHPPIAIQAFKRKVHVLTEKPAGVYTRQVREMNEAAEASGCVFGIMFNQRTVSLYQKIRDLVQSGELGRILRFQWTITTWYRTQRYYDAGGWRATWAGEGGGVLTNQCPHNLDLWQWMLGMPKRIRAFCSEGKYHRIEVEDEATIYAEYEDGMTGVFITSSGETPGDNRLEIAGENGLLTTQGGLTFLRNRQSSIDFSNDPDISGMKRPECWETNIPILQKEKGHVVITRNWVNAILNGEPLLAPGVEGINSLQIANAAYLSSWLDRWIEIPVDEDLYYRKLQEKIASSKYVKPERERKRMSGHRMIEVKRISTHSSYHGWPTVERLGGTDLAVVVSAGRERHLCPFGQVHLLRSTDGGITWEDPVVLANGPLDDRDAGVLRTAKGTLLVNWFTSVAWLRRLEQVEAGDSHPKVVAFAEDDGFVSRCRKVRALLAEDVIQRELGVWMIRSTDGGHTWTPKTRIGEGAGSPHGPTQLADGRLLFVGNWKYDDPVEQARYAGPTGMGVRVSSDDGGSWQPLGAVPLRPGDEPATYHEPHAVQADDGRIIVHIRNHSPRDKSHILQSESEDGGRTFSVPRNTGLIGLPAHLRVLRDGRLLSTYGYRREPYGNRASVSEDGGHTWSDPIILDEKSETRDLGYPSTVEMDDGSLITVWYEKMPGDALASVQMARWGWE